MQRSVLPSRTRIRTRANCETSDLKRPANARGKNASNCAFISDVACASEPAAARPSDETAWSQSLPLGDALCIITSAALAPILVPKALGALVVHSSCT
jgi:hypothetical protein